MSSDFGHIREAALFQKQVDLFLQQAAYDPDQISRAINNCDARILLEPPQVRESFDSARSGYMYLKVVDVKGMAGNVPVRLTIRITFSAGLRSASTCLVEAIQRPRVAADGHTLPPTSHGACMIGGK